MTCLSPHPHPRQHHTCDELSCVSFPSVLSSETSLSPTSLCHHKPRDFSVGAFSLPTPIPESSQRQRNNSKSSSTVFSEVDQTPLPQVTPGLGYSVRLLIFTPSLMRGCVMSPALPFLVLRIMTGASTRDRVEASGRRLALTCPALTCLALTCRALTCQGC